MFREILIFLHYEKSSAKIDTCLEHPKVNITMRMTMQKNHYSSFSDNEEWR